jgi:outer membrane protein
MRPLKLNRNTTIQRASFCALVFWGFTTVSALALPNAQQLAAYEAAPEDQRVTLLVHLAKSGQGEDAGYLLEQFPLQGPHAQNRQLFIEGLLLRSRGDLTGAAEKFRGALANDPSLTMVRAELAQTLVLLDENDSAKHHLQLLAAEAPTDEAASGIRSFIDKVDARKPYKFSGYVSFAPSTNLNNGSRHTTVYSPIFGADLPIDDANRATSGLGVAGGFNAAYTKRLGNNFSFIAAGGVDARLYDDEDFNSYGLSQSLELRYMFERGYLGLGAIASESLENKSFGVYSVSYGPRVSLSLQISPQDSFSTSTTYEWRDTLDKLARDSTALSVNSAWTHGFNSSLTATAFGRYDQVDNGLAATSYATTTGGLSVYKELTYGITAKLTGQYAQSDFEGYNAVAGVTRQDHKLSGSIELTKRDFNIFGFAPSLEYSYSTNESNINLFDYDIHAVDARLTKDF